MVEKDTILKEKVWYVGICNIKDIYNYAYEWLKDEDYFIIEDKYKETAKGDSKDMEIMWKCNKKITDYFRINIEIFWKILGMIDVEVEIDGKKKKMNKVAELTATIKGVLEKDYTSDWGATGFHKFLKEAYNKYIIPSRTEEMEVKTAEIVQDLAEEIKAMLEFTGKR